MRKIVFNTMDLYTNIWTVNTHVNDIEGLVTAKVCAYKLNNARYEKNVFAHTVAVMRLHLSKKNNPLLIFTFLKHFLQRIF